MNQPPPAARKLARWLLTYDSADVRTPGGKSPGVFFVCDKLRHHLTIYAGVAGFRSLLSRAHALAKAEVTWLDAVRVRGDGSLEWPGADESQLDTKKIAAGEVALLAQLLGLLVTFIGESLTLLLVREIWPEAPYEGSDTGTEEDT